MLRELTIRDFVIVKTVTLGLDRGFHVLTGETGAGKSILIDALMLVLGARASDDIIRPGAQRADIQAVFEPSSAIKDWLIAHDLDQTEDELILRRVIDKQGKSRAYINGALVTATQLRELGERLVDIHGQHAHQSLMRPEAQRELLDSHGQLSEQCQNIRRAWQQLQEITDKLNRVTESALQRAQRLEALQWQANELQTLSPKSGEWEQIVHEHERLANGRSLLDSMASAVAALSDDEVGAQRNLSRAIDLIRSASKHDPALSDTLTSLESAYIAVTDASSEFTHYMDSFDLDPQRLQQLDDRMQAMFAAARKYRCEPEDLPAIWQATTDELSELRTDEDLEALQAKEIAARKTYDELAQELRKQRKKTAKTLSQAVTQKMQVLGMPGGQFRIDLDEAPASIHGCDKVSFMVSSHDSLQPAPLNRIASGGELSRIALALSVVASQATDISTLVFDEVDSGVSGAVAEMVGRLLSELGTKHQVLCVTHLPQVAACAQHHFFVEKQSDKEGSIQSTITQLNEAGRIQAIAQLLGGMDITETTRKHARELLKSTKTGLPHTA